MAAFGGPSCAQSWRVTCSASCLSGKCLSPCTRVFLFYEGVPTWVLVLAPCVTALCRPCHGLL